MKQAILSTLFAIGFVLVGAGSGFAQTASVDGDWDGGFETPGGARPFKITLKMDGEKLSGTVKRPTGDVPLTGTIKGSDISFGYTINYGGNDLTLSFAGKVTGETMGGTLSFGGQAEAPWTAKRVAKPNP